MADVLASAGSFIGGLGIFLLAVGMLTDGLKIAAGDALRDILARSTRTPLRGIAAGVLVTAIVQSSSAVTVAIIGFVNAGLLTLAQALGVVYGANIGTTITGWLVAAVGFDVNIEAFALPLIGVGMLLRLAGNSTRLGAAGEALAGFGLFFIGVDVLKTAFEGAAATLDISALQSTGFTALAACFGLGVLMTVLTQSSSAAIAITLTAATGGMIGIEPAAAMVIGANVGTTSTAALAAIGATSAARRVAAAHVLFNLVTGVVALLLLPGLLWLVSASESVLGLQGIPAVTLALFHTVFNILGVVIMLPFSRRLAAALELRFASRAEALGRPRHLDPTSAATPSLAVDALVLESTRLLAMVRQWSMAAVSSEGADQRQLQIDRDAIATLDSAMLDFMARLERSRMSSAVAERVPVILRVLNYLDDVMDLASDALGNSPHMRRLDRGAAGAAIADYRAAGLALMAACDPTLADFDSDRLDEDYHQLRSRWHELKDALLHLAAEGRVAVRDVNTAIELLRNQMRVADQLIKASRRLFRLGLGTPGENDPATTAPTTPAAAEQTDPSTQSQDITAAADPPATPG